MENKKIHLVMPMAGRGSRFGGDAGTPKPLIMLQDRPFFFWATQSIIKFTEVKDITFVVLKEHVENYSIDERILEYYPQANIVVIDRVLDGAVLTCREGLRNINDDIPIVFNDCDHAFTCKSFYNYLGEEFKEDVQGGILTFNSNNPAYSYLLKDENDFVRKTIEKKVISNEAICGCYYFRNKGIFEKTLEKYLTTCDYSEFYVSGMYNIIAGENAKVISFKTDLHITFGVPEEYDEAKKDKRLSQLL